MRTRGLYDPLISREASTIWPIRPTRGVNRGYRDQFFRPDDSSVTIQGVGTPVVYRGDRLPKELLRRRVHHRLDDEPGAPLHDRRRRHRAGCTAATATRKGEILASWDERFRPVNLLGGPDGTLYVVDMYRGVVQETDLLDGLPARLHQDARPGAAGAASGASGGSCTTRRRPAPKPALSKATPAELVQALSHPNGWWRDTAQQLLVQRGDKSVAPQLKQLAAQAPDWRTKLHALWTLDGLDAIEPAHVQRGAGRQVARRARVGAPVVGALARRAEPSARRRGSAADGRSELDRPPSACGDDRRAAAGRAPRAPRSRLLTRYGSDPITVDATISGLRGSEAEVLTRVVAGASAAAADAGCRRRCSPRRLPRAATSPACSRLLARVDGCDAGAAGSGRRCCRGSTPVSAAAAGGRGGRGRRTRCAGSRDVVALPAEPTALTRLAAVGEDETGARREARRRRGSTGRASRRPSSTAPPLTPDEQKRFDAGAELYKNLCVGCHQPDGRGGEARAEPGRIALSSSGRIRAPPARILLGGKEGAIGLMPPLGGALNDEQIAAVLTYIRREWGHTALAGRAGRRHGNPRPDEDAHAAVDRRRAAERPWRTGAGRTVGRLASLPGRPRRLSVTRWAALRFARAVGRLASLPGRARRCAPRYRRVRYGHDGGVRS